MCRYVTQPGLLTTLLEYLTVQLEYLDLILAKNYPDFIPKNQGYGYPIRVGFTVCISYVYTYIYTCKQCFADSIPVQQQVCL